MTIDVKEKLLQFPVKIKTTELEMMKLTEELSQNVKVYSQIEYDIKSDIGLNLNFKNDAQRKGAYELRLKDNKQYQELVDKCRVSHNEIRRHEIEIRYLHNMFQAYLTIAKVSEDMSI